ncbi:MAG: helix-turn-helix domain-containing protein [Promethearchaeati archaeon SRVP18_Atabeyarchaeia-1]
MSDNQNDIPPSALKIFGILKISGPLTPKAISNRTTFSSRTVRYALKILLKLGLVRKLPNLHDARQFIYKT